MAQEMFPEVKAAPGVGGRHMDLSLQGDDERALGNVKSILVDAAVEVGALIDAVCCRCGHWIDSEHYRPHPGTSSVRSEDPGSVIRLALTASDWGLPAGGYVEMCALPKEKVIEADGGYYDASHEPRNVVNVSLRWNELNRETLGQVLVVMFNRILREYMAKESRDSGSRMTLRGPDTDRLCLA